MQGIIFYEQRSIATKWFKQASRKADARKIELIEMPLKLKLTKLA
jgi:hypothetical protein